MDSALADEILSINAIYGSDTLFKTIGDSESYLLTIPCTDATLRLSFPNTYPEDAPLVLGLESSGSEAKKGAGNKIVSVARDALAQCFAPGQPCVFDLIEHITTSLPAELKEQDQEDSIGDSDRALLENDPKDDSPVDLIEAPKWTLSEVSTEKKSAFVGRAAPVTHPDQARSFLRHLLATDKKVAKATHNITAWRIRGLSGIVYQDCDDDGETAAGGRLLHLLQIMNVWNALVVVSRWYGGVKLGPDRFRLINGVARDCLVKGGFDKESQR